MYYVITSKQLFPLFFLFHVGVTAAGQNLFERCLTAPRNGIVGPWQAGSLSGSVSLSVETCTTARAS